MKINISRFEIPKIFGVIAGSLSLFRMLNYIIEFRIAETMKMIIEQYDKLLYLIEWLFKCPLEWLEKQFDFTLPEWWPHFLILWLLLGTIALRASKEVNKRDLDASGDKEDEENLSIQGILADAVQVFLGGFTLIGLILLWLVNGSLYGRKNNGVRYSPFRVLIIEALITIGVTVGFLILNAFGF